MTLFRHPSMKINQIDRVYLLWSSFRLGQVVHGQQVKTISRFSPKLEKTRKELKVRAAFNPFSHEKHVTWLCNSLIVSMFHNAKGETLSKWYHMRGSYYFQAEGLTPSCKKALYSFLTKYLQLLCTNFTFLHTTLWCQKDAFKIDQNF